jgi:uncharacterized protein (TIGR02996 family)
MAKRPSSPTGRPTLLGLLQAIREDPESDEPRLILADWLEDQPDPADQARGQFIRLQCEAARAKDPQPLFARTWPLERQWGAAWLGGMPKLPDSELPGYERGLQKLELRPRELFSAAMSAWLCNEAAAWVDQVWLIEPSGARVKQLARSPILAGLTFLAVWFLKDGTGLADLVASPRLTYLRKLDLKTDESSIGLGDWLPALSLPGLKSLRLSECGLRGEDVDTLASWAGLSQLEGLDLSSNPLGDEPAATLSKMTRMAGLRRLNLSGTALSTDGMFELSRNLSTLRHRPVLLELDLSNNFLGDGIHFLTGAPGLANLTTLRLVTTGAGSTVGEELAASRYLGNLRELDLRMNADLVGTRGAVALRERFGDRVLL